MTQASKWICHRATRREAKPHRNKALVVTGTANQLATDKGAGGNADHEDHHAHPALAGAQPLLPLHLQRQIDQHGKHQQLGEHHQQHAHQITGQPCQMGRQNGVVGTPLNQNQQQQCNAQRRRKPDGGQRRLRREQQQGERSDSNQQTRPLPVEATVATDVELLEVAVDEKDRQRPERQVDPEESSAS